MEENTSKKPFLVVTMLAMFFLGYCALSTVITRRVPGTFTTVSSPSSGIITPFGTLPSEQVLNFSDQPLTDDQFIQKIKATPQIKSLTLNRTKVTEAGLAVLAGHAELLVLNLYDIPLTKKSVYLEKLVQLRQLSAYGQGNTDVGVAHLKNLKSLEELSLSGPNLGDASLATLGNFHELTSLTLCAQKCTDTGLAHVAALKKLRKLNLYSSPITDAGLVSLKGLTALEQISLSSLKMKGPGLAHLAGLPNLQHLNLWSDSITDESLQYLSTAKPLVHLDLGANPGLRGKGLSSLQNLPLHLLNLNGTGLQNDGLAAIGGMKSLQTLSMQSTPITDPGLEHLRGLQNLQSLDVRATALTRPALLSLKAALPHLHISRGPIRPWPMN